MKQHLLFFACTLLGSVGLAAEATHRVIIEDGGEPVVYADLNETDARRIYQSANGSGAFAIIRVEPPLESQLIFGCSGRRSGH